MTELVRKPASASNGGELDTNFTNLPVADESTSGIITNTDQTITGKKKIVSSDNLEPNHGLEINNAADTKFFRIGAYEMNVEGTFYRFLSQAARTNGTYYNLEITDDSLIVAGFSSSLTTPAARISKRENSQETAGNQFLIFGAGGSNCGGIQSNGTNTAAFFTISDARLKYDINPLGGSLDKLMSLKPSTFKFNGKEESQTGFIAQEVQEVFPEYVTKADLTEEDSGVPEGEAGEYLSISGMDAMTAHLVSAIQEQQAMIEALQAEVEILKGN